MREYAVVIVGGGPTGMMLAGELALAGVDVAIVERRPTPELAGSRAGGFHSRTIEILDQRGIAGRFLDEGQVAQTARFGAMVLDISDFPTRHPYGLGLWQNHIERIMAGWLDELGVLIHRGREVIGFVQDEGCVEVRLASGETIRAAYLVGADGGRSVIRRAAGIAFEGWDATRSHLIAEVRLSEEPEWGTRLDAVGVHGLGRVDYEIRDGEVVYADEGPVRVMVTEERVGPATKPTLDDLRAALTHVYHTDFGVHNPTWLSRFTDATRQAAAYRDRRVLLAGDAAHIHSPAGGQGIGLGVQDAVNLGWKLAQVVKGVSPDSLLDTYHTERHPADACALRHTMAQSATQRQDERVCALRDITADLLTINAARVRVAALIHGLDVRYDLGDDHPLLGRRMPDFDLITATGPLRTYALLHAGRPTLINFGDRGSIDITPWADRVRLTDATYDGAWELPVLGTVTAPSAVLIRPDGHAAWVGDGTSLGLDDALTRWFGSPAMVTNMRSPDPQPGGIKRSRRHMPFQ
ncbi:MULTISPECIES: FAD-dependent monooxygenase [unclassified Frankia]|uniref:FAD-dependent monooxygenase n=2 Tax=Frankia TaxID=1854 RepID=UPI001EF45F4C|nr:MULTISPECIES: FAD-dependent monooxygenase [unclassified Frankia]